MTDTLQDKKAVSIRFPLQVYRRIKDRADKHHRSFNKEVIYILLEYFRTIEPTNTVEE